MVGRVLNTAKAAAHVPKSLSLFISEEEEQARGSGRKVSRMAEQCPRLGAVDTGERFATAPTVLA